MGPACSRHHEDETDNIPPKRPGSVQARISYQHDMRKMDTDISGIPLDTGGNSRVNTGGNSRIPQATTLR